MQLSKKKRKAKGNNAEAVQEIAQTSDTKTKGEKSVERERDCKNCGCEICWVRDIEKRIVDDCENWRGNWNLLKLKL